MRNTSRCALLISRFLFACLGSPAVAAEDANVDDIERQHRLSFKPPLAVLQCIPHSLIVQQPPPTRTNVGTVPWPSFAVYWALAGAQRKCLASVLIFYLLATGTGKLQVLPPQTLPHPKHPPVSPPPTRTHTFSYPARLQEFALGRAIAQRPRRTRASEGPSPSENAEPSDDALTEFVSAFKQMASQLDEDGAKNLLMWSPLFMPNIQGLMRRPQGDQQQTGSRRRSQEAAAQVQNRGQDSCGDPASAAARGGRNIPRARPAPKMNPVAEQRDARVHRLQQMYGCGGSAEDMPTEASPMAPQRDALLSPGGGIGARSPGMPTSTRSAVQAPGAGGAGVQSSFDDDDWEAEVDGLLDWTTGLQVPSSPG